MPRVTVIDYGMGNLMSVAKALAACGATEVAVSGDPADVASAGAVVLPGVGHFGDGMRRMAACGLADATRRAIESGKPFLGICLGMQLLMQGSEEAPGVPGLGLFQGAVRRLPGGPGLKVPHMGWNTVAIRRPSPILEGVRSGEHFYFVHSFACDPEDSRSVIGETTHGSPFCSIMGAGNVLATQFHPEKSQDAGLAILRNFLATAARPP